MTIQIEASNSLEAWKAGCEILVRDTDAFNIVTTITNPAYFEENWLTDFNPKLINRAGASLSDVINTIYPYRLFNPATDSRQDLYIRHKQRHERATRIHEKTKRSWGTYFGRMTCFGQSEINQLESIISAINNRSRNYKASLVMHISSADTDSLIKTLGNPCLQYMAFLCPTPQTISLLAVYRNHDYFYKAFGNFIGLGKLLEFVCGQTKRVPDSLICHSAHAYFECSKDEITRLARLT